MKFNSIIPELAVLNLEKSLDFYVRILEFKIEYCRNEEKFAFLSMNEAQLMLEQDNGNWVTGVPEYPRGRGINFEIEVFDIKALVERLQDGGHKLFREPQEVWRQAGKSETGSIEFLVQDPDGYLLRFSERLKPRNI